MLIDQKETKKTQEVVLGVIKHFWPNNSIWSELKMLGKYRVSTSLVRPSTLISKRRKDKAGWKNERRSAKRPRRRRRKRRRQRNERK